MNKKIIIIIISSLLLILSLFGILARRSIIPGPDFLGLKNHNMYQDHRRMMRGHRMGRNFCTPGFMRNTLNLDEGQIEKIEKFNRKFDREYAAYNEKIRPQRKRLRQLLSRKSSDDFNEIRKLLEEISEVNIELRMIRIRQGVEISKILSHEQMKELQKERRKMFQNRGRHFRRE